MVLEVPAQSDYPLYEVTGELLETGYFAGQNETINSPRSSPVGLLFLVGFVGVWREEGVEYYFLLRRHVPLEDPVYRPPARRQQRPTRVPPVRKPNARERKRQPLE